jgi:uncharacterized membrane protein YeaQ/YmgE (transglycosylase-associated protein family)
MGILTWVIVGMIAGWFTGLAMGSRDPAALRDLLLGAGGALAGGLLAGALLGVAGSIDDFNFVTTLASSVGAVAVVMFVKALSGSRVAAID